MLCDTKKEVFATVVKGSGRFPREGNGYTVQYSYLENPLDRGDWQATVHGVAKSWTRLRTHDIE